MQDVRHATVGETDTVGSVSGPAEPASEVEGGGHLPPPPSIKDLPPPTKGTVEPPEAPVQGAKMPASPLIPPPPPDPTLGDVSRESHTPAKYPAVDPAGQPHGKKNGSAGQPVTAVQETVTSENPHSNPNPSPNPNPKPNPNPNPGHHRPVAGLQQQPYRVQSPAQAGGPAPGQAHAHASSPVGQQIPLQGPPLPRHGLPMMPPRPGPPMAQLPRHGSPLVHTPHHVPPMGLPSHHRPPMGQPPPPSPVLRAHPFAEPAARPPRFQEPVVRQPGYQVPRPGGSSYRGEAQILYQEEVPPQYHEERLSYVEEGAAFQGEGMYGEKGAVYVEEGGSLTEESPTQVPGQARHPRRQTSTLRISKWVNPIPDDPEDGKCCPVLVCFV
ncbi:proline-rich protein 2-like [Penaeus chinensis]|uniref:proline-rich protein 2-like n=1 Tax=Penaeus chinensis TaxID=139456 RepID=UPI001FB78806|nr:proline-rich protein 2-like [Penaeus chinensis]XP_047472617.1 proline-rich protein 2-like [Penaeus chinensis]XP_047472618.1 proline-rich protein 2-like [Penaeus chinensis]